MAKVKSYPDPQALENTESVKPMQFTVTFMTFSISVDPFFHKPFTKRDTLHKLVINLTGQSQGQ